MAATDDQQNREGTVFVHLAIDGEVSPDLGIYVARERMPAVGTRLILKGDPVLVEDIRQERRGRWVIYLRNFTA